MMSTLAYAALTTRREQTPAPTPAAAADAGTPGVGKWVDTAAALVPAEVLAAHAFLIELVTTTTQDPGGKSMVVISNPANAEILFWALLALSGMLYVVGHWKSWGGWDFLRVLIPPAAFVLWCTLQPATALDGVVSWSEFTRYLVGVLGVILLASIANLLAYKADQQTPKT